MRTVLTIGNFDGVHRGHAALVQRARAIADAHKPCDVIAMTFDPHPLSVLRPGAEPPRLTSRPRKVELLEQAGADRVIVLEPTPELLAQTPEAFVERLVREHQPVAIVEGPDFRFGKGRRGDNALLAQFGTQHGFQAVVVERVELALSDLLIVPVNSSTVRWLLSCGRVADAARCLGRAYELEGIVVEGQKRGRTIGVPTVNLDPAITAEFVVPADGVYAGLVRLDDGRDVTAAISVGSKPTFGHSARTVEAHLLDFTGDLYGRTVRIRFARWLRDQQRFADLDTLKAQIARDLDQTRELDRLTLLRDPAHCGPAVAV